MEREGSQALQVQGGRQRNSRHLTTRYTLLAFASCISFTHLTNNP
jgi:hypothetical protein